MFYVWLFSSLPPSHLTSSPGYSRCIMLVLSPFSGMQKENRMVLNELGGQCWSQHQLTQLLIMALIRAADGERHCSREYKRPAETCRSHEHMHTLLLEYEERLYERICVHFKNPSFLTQLSSSFVSSSPFNVDLRTIGSN